MTTKQIQAKIRQLGWELMEAEANEAYCENFIEKRKEHNLLLEKLYKLEKRVF